MKSALVFTLGILFVGLSATAGFAMPSNGADTQFYALGTTQPAEAMSDQELATIEGAAFVGPQLVGVNVIVDRSLNRNDVNVEIIRDVDLRLTDVNVIVLGTQRR